MFLKIRNNSHNKLSLINYYNCAFSFMSSTMKTDIVIQPLISNV